MFVTSLKVPRLFINQKAWVVPPNTELLCKPIYYNFYVLIIAESRAKKNAFKPPSGLGSCLFYGVGSVVTDSLYNVPLIVCRALGILCLVLVLLCFVCFV